MTASLEPLGQHRFTAKGDRGADRDLLDTSQSSSARAFSADANGSIEGLEQANGTINNNPSATNGSNDAYNYDPYGDQIDKDASFSDDAKNNPFRFQGFYYDAGTETYDMQARSYRPEISEFLSPDHYESASADEALMSGELTNSRFMFAGANPVDNVEFDGHCADGPDGPCRPLVGEEPDWRRKRRQEIQDARRGPNSQSNTYPASQPPIDVEEVKYQTNLASQQPEAKPGPEPSTIKKVLNTASEATELEVDPGCFVRVNSGCQTVEFADNDLSKGAEAVIGFAPYGKLLKPIDKLGGPLMRKVFGQSDEAVPPAGSRPMAGGAPLASGLRQASPGLRGLYADGPLTEKSIIGLRDQLTSNGFARQQLSLNRRGYIFRGPAGENVRVQPRGGGWDVRVQNANGNYLDRFGDVANGPGDAHGLTVRSR